MKNQWSQMPFVLRRKILLTYLAGIASIAVSLVIFIATADRILLALGGIILSPLWYWVKACGASPPGANTKWWKASAPVSARPCCGATARSS